MKNNKLALLLVAVGLIGFSVYSKQNVDTVRPAPIDVMELTEPASNLKPSAEKIISILLSVSDHKADCKRLRDLYIDLATLISLDEKDEVVTNTDEVRQANALAGVMLKMDVKGKYKDLSLATKELVVTAIGDDDIKLSAEIRTKASEAFKALAWACNEASKK